MAKRFITPRINRLFIESVEAITSEMSKRHKFFVVNENTVPCPNCIQDPTTGSSTGKYKTGGTKPFTGKTCPVCKTKGKQVTVRKIPMTANVTLGTASPGADGQTPFGQILKGYAEVETYARNEKALNAANYFVIDDRKYTMHVHPEPSGLQTKVTVLFTLKRDE